MAGSGLERKIQKYPIFDIRHSEKESGSWVLDGFSAKLDEGSAKISGKVWLVPDLKADVTNANIQKIASIFPNISKYGVIGTLSASMEIKGEGKDIFTTGEGVLNKAVIAKIPFEDVSANGNTKRES